MNADCLSNDELINIFNSFCEAVNFEICLLHLYVGKFFIKYANALFILPLFNNFLLIINDLSFFLLKYILLVIFRFGNNKFNNNLAHIDGGL